MSAMLKIGKLKNIHFQINAYVLSDFAILHLEANILEAILNIQARVHPKNVWTGS